MATRMAKPAGEAMQIDALWSVCRELGLARLAVRGAPMYRLHMNRCGSHAKPGPLGHNFNEMSFKIRSGRCFHESFDGLTKAAP
jgi:hypothetical protein